MRAGRIESFVPDQDILLERLHATDDLDGVKAVVAELIETVGTWVYGVNERNGERVLGQLALAGGGNVFFTNTDARGMALRREANREPIHPQSDRISRQVKERSDKARAQRVAVGKKE